MRTWRWWLIVEVVLAYALPAWFWLWGLLTVPVWMWGANRDDLNSILNLVCIVGGLLGAIGIITLLGQAISNQRPTTLKFTCITVLCACGLLAIWTMMTGHFHAFVPNWFTVIGIIVPTVCTVHLLALCWRPPASNSRETYLGR